MNNTLNLDAETCQELFNLAEDVAHVGYWMWDIKTNRVKWSKTKIHIYGEDSETFEPTFEAFLAVLDDETRQRIEQEIQAVLSGEKPYYDLQHQIHLKNGRTAWIHEKGFVVRDKDGTPIRMEGVVFDITETMRLLASLKEEQERLSHLKLFNEITHLPNAKALELVLERLLKEAQSRITLAIVDIEDFGSINSSHGRQQGDRLLQAVAERLKAAYPNRVFHLNGDEFALLLTDRNIEHACQQLSQHLKPPYLVNQLELSPGFTVGCSYYPEQADSAQALIQNAQTALRMHKRQPQPHTPFLLYTAEMTETLAQQRVMLDKLRRALHHHPEQFIPYFQPQVNALTGMITGFEALVRWRQADNTLVSPAAFLPVARRHGLLHLLDQHVIKVALDQLAQWHAQGYPARLSVNFEVSDLYNHLPEQLLEQPAEVRNSLTLEITEEALMHCEKDELSLLEALKKAGIRLAIDDFGTGYSSLRYLHKLPADELKIDRSFVEQLPDDIQARNVIAIIDTIVERFGFDTVVEGVETEAQLQYLTAKGFHVIQGFYYSPPVDAEKATALLKEQPWKKAD